MNKQINRYILLVLLLWLLPWVQPCAEPLEFAGQLSLGTSASNKTDEGKPALSIRYLPFINYTCTVRPEMKLDAEVSINAYAACTFEDLERDMDFYRLKLRMVTAQSDLRLGLQKINFGQAQLLRPLMWFDRLSPTDPLKMAGGVYALRYRYTCLNNSNLWLWGLYGNPDPKGIETLPTSKRSIEPGGRFQFPLLDGEGAFSFHGRRVDAESEDYHDYDEFRYALDGKWDVGVGFWVETMAQFSNSDDVVYRWLKISTVGMDYTLGIGNGLYVMTEHMMTQGSSEFSEADESTQVTALLTTYSLSLYDNLSLIGLFSWELEAAVIQADWRHTWNNIELDLSVFKYPEVLADSFGLTSSFGGFGGRIMLIYTH